MKAAPTVAVGDDKDDSSILGVKEPLLESGNWEEKTPPDEGSITASSSCLASNVRLSHVIHGLMVFTQESSPYMATQVGSYVPPGSDHLS